MDEIILQHGTKRMSVDLEGAWITSLTDGDQTILYPRTSLQAPDGSTKQRGGCHVCLPNFGPGGESGLSQHGFGRTMTWVAIEQGDDTLRLRLNNCPNPYEEMVAELKYELTDKGCEMTLQVRNEGKEILVIAPAFHPYFNYKDQAAVRLNGQTIPFDILNDAQYEKRDDQTLQLDDNNVQVSSQRLPVWAVWTDGLGAYLCVEPTQSGNAFLTENKAGADCLLPGAEASYACWLSW